jgi:cobalt/nickel transport system ATP-binding protein
MKPEERVVELDCITHIYPDMTKVQICGLEFIVNRGERVGILGANGCGKTTLIKHLLGILMPKEGSVRVFGLDPVNEYSKIRERIVGCRILTSRSWVRRFTMTFSLPP